MLVLDSKFNLFEIKIHFSPESKLDQAIVCWQASRKTSDFLALSHCR